MRCDWDTIIERVAKVGALVHVSVIGVDGSTPRGVGAWMLVWLDETEQTIGGGQLEFEAIAKARELLLAHGDLGPLWQRETKVYPLGPALGQCCGGVARLLFEVLTHREIKALQFADDHNPAACLLVRPTASGHPLIVASDRKENYGLPIQIAHVIKDMLAGARPRSATYVKACDGADAWYIEPAAVAKMPLYIYGAGHVGRAIVDIVKELDFDTCWVDTTRSRFPDSIPDHVVPAITPVPDELARLSLPQAFHLVLTFSHALDLAICRVLLARADFVFLGLIGSQTKRARFLKRLHDSGIAEATLARLICPIGISGIRGKEPETIAVSVAAQLIETLELSRQKISNSQRGAEHV